MKTNAIKSFVKQNIPWAFFIGGWGIASYATYTGVSKINDANNEAKAYIQNNDIKRYNELIEQDGYPKTFNWVIEAQKLETELKLDSIAKTNYALGMQAVRDSLANANKK